MHDGISKKSLSITQIYVCPLTNGAEMGTTKEKEASIEASPKIVGKVFG
jgi:hypothetical protein